MTDISRRPRVNFPEASQKEHSETGVRTLKDEFDKVVWNNEKHLEQIQKAVNR